MEALARAFRIALGDAEVSDDALEAALARAMAASREAWPDMAPVDPADFVRHLAQLVRTQPDPVAALDALHVADVYLTFACAAGVTEALEALERTHLAQLPRALARMGLSAAMIDDTLQTMRAELLVRRADGQPRILDYSGRGRLAGWLRAVAARTALKQVPPAARNVELDASVHAAQEHDLELAYMKKTYGAAFQGAFRAAFRSLSVDERLLLKQRLKHRLGVVELGALYGVNPGTITRRVTAARDRLATLTRTEMMNQLKIGTDQLSSIMRLIEGELDITLSSHDDSG